ncbi:MAG: bifunctional demethylmenaquinone methyltransferase/2-methoxy-6-polyprenyl-1,4-benzoquinol methylase UbiE [SAR324 cluster bacterium]|nr:bifunctional demethylmenaquinone methyltransferase/2-methoxy-6-polyprenyl-1,4-benzoquinol methylase UbiE [SAR324 cluster bacterium]MBL7034467.1 bifunctional demethylmenaquinone methyltransferase/2-methoxy-6-polyprenyl-1,4-benzoquinol methylase UbiE [SAR324 cluster bacterium]
MTYTLPKTEEKSSYVEKKFDEIAQKYDLFNDLITLGMHRYWKRFVVRQTGLRQDNSCLDLCCGTGDIAREIIRQYPSCKVTGLDFSQEMLNVAESKNSSNSGIEYLQGDAMDIPFSEASFDAVTIGYGLRNVPNLDGCLQEILRVLKPGGVLVSLDVGKVRLPLIAELNNFYFFRIVPLIGNWLMPDQEMFKYLPHSSLEYPNQEMLKRLLLETGFMQAEIHDFVFGASTVHVAHKSNNS